MKKPVVFLFFVLFTTAVFSQRIITSLQAKHVAVHFTSSNGAVKWQIPVVRGKSLDLVWHEQSVMFAKNEGIRTFAGYQNDKLTAVISVWRSYISGNVFSEQGELRLTTSEEGFLCLEPDTKPLSCGLCCSETPDDHNLHEPPRVVSAIVGRNSSAKETKIFPDDNVLRIFRLALPVDYNVFKTEFNSDVMRVKAFWATAQATLNELYMRDIGVRFEVVNDDRLIRNLPEKEIFQQASSNYVINSSTYEINKLIGSENYDMGLFITHSTGHHGLAYKSFGYFNKHKASATTVSTQLYAIAHELGHLLGASHVHEQASNSSGYSHKTELGLGQSVMGYGSPQNFFSLVSVNDIRSELLGLPHYVDKERTKLSGTKSVAPNYDNFPFGVKTSVREPKIDTLTAQSRYLLPPNTFFGFQLKAMSANSGNLLYMVQPADKAIQRVSRAKFHTYAPSINSDFLFQESYGSSGNLERAFSTSVGNKHLFWVGVSTGKEAHLRPNEVVRYDTRISQVEVVDAKPFRITSPLKILYNGGEKFTLRWEADPKIFAGTRVRILLSDDFGKTFKYTLAENTENDGECELVMPHISFGSVAYKNNISRVRAGVIKVEVIDHIAYALSAINPLDNTGRFAGGFELDPATAITFTDVPPSRVVLPFGSEISLKHEVKATTQCRNKAIELAFEEYIDENTSQYSKVVTRKWTAKDKCGKEFSFVQLIYIEKQVESFKDENTDSDNEDGDSDEGNDNSNEGNDNSNEGNDNSNEGNDNSNEGNDNSNEGNDNSNEGNDNSNEGNDNSDEGNDNSNEGNDNSNEGNDNSNEGNDNSNVQTDNTIVDTPKPDLGHTEWIVYNGVSAEVSSENYLKIAAIERYKDLYVEIFNELGQKVFAAKDYQRKGGVFRGYANVKGVVGKGKRLPSGTYFYVLKYKNQDKKMHQKSGYLYVR